MPTPLEQLLRLEAAGRLGPEAQAGLDDARRRGLIPDTPIPAGPSPLGVIPVTPTPQGEPEGPITDVAGLVPNTAQVSQLVEGFQAKQEQVGANMGDLETGTRLSARGLLNDVGLLMGSPAAEGAEVLIPNIVSAFGSLLGNERLSELYAASLQQSRDIVGIQEEPSGFTQFAAEFGPGAMLPIPKVASTRILALPPAKRIAAEVLFPFNQIRETRPVVAATVAPPALLTGIEAVIDNATRQIEDVAQEREARAVVDEFVPVLPPQFIATPQEKTETPALINAIEDSDAQRSDFGPRSPFDPAGGSPQDIEQDDFVRITQGVLAAALITQAFGTRGRMGGRSFRDDPTLFSGTRPPREQVTSVATKFEEAFFDQMAPIVDAVRRAIPQQYDQFVANLKTTMTPGGMSSRIRNALKVGNLPNTHITIPSPVVWLETFARMTEIQRAGVDDVLRALDRLDLMTSGNIPFGRVAREQLELRIRLATEDPLVAKMVDEAHEIFRGVRDYIHDSGRWTDETRERITRENPNFVPSNIDFGRKDRSLASRFFETADDMFTKHEADFLKKRKGAVGPFEGLPPSQLLEPYIQQVIRSVENNRIRREFLTAMEGSELLGTVIKRTSRNKFTSDVFINGESVSFQVGDDAIRRALQFNPRLIIPIANGAKRILVEWTTGMMNPLFVATSAAYEGGSAILLKKPGQAVGLLDKVVKRVTGKTLPVDPSIIVSPITGPVQSGYANMMFAMGRNMEVSLRVNGPVTQLIGEANAKRLARIGMRAYENSVANVFEQYGAGNAVFAPSREIESSATMLDKVAKGFFRLTNEEGFVPNRLMTLWADYMHLATQFHNGIRMQSLAANVTPTDIHLSNVLRNREEAQRLARLDPQGFETTKAAQRTAQQRLTRQAADTRTLGGDTSQIGGGSLLGRGVQAFVSTTPYANVALQVIAEHARAFNRNRARYTATMSGVVVGGAALVYNQFRGNPAAQEHYFNVLNAAQRASFIPIYAPNSDRILFTVPIEHMYRPLWSPTMEMFGAVTGMKRGITAEQLEEALLQGNIASLFSLDLTEKEVQELKAGAATSFLQASPASVPTVIDMGLVTLGQRANPARVVTGADLLRDISTETITSEQTRRVPGDLFPAQVEELLTALMGTGAGPLLSSINGYMREVADSNDISDALVVARKRFVAAQADRSLPIRALFSDLEFRISTNDANAQLYKAKLEGLKEITRRFRFDVANPGGGGRAAGTREPLPSGIMPPDIRGTALEFVLESAAKLTG